MINKIKLVTFGKIKEKYIKEGIFQYCQRLQMFCKIETIELKDQGKENNSKTLERYINENTFLLDEEGEEYNSISFSEFIKKMNHMPTFIIGGYDGFNSEIKEKFNKISLSQMTMIHDMTRLFLFEQIYRSFMVLNNKKYHK
ncbi:23S rRNA (pseudouridine(1915)-N(3))-methyltransferase RlmH [Patescibacteria group bacterium]|nr:23S rRNA (pseudouridine(1915)-N(3))-methyltransferase RlmH [Patescibacteria group bacterium]